MNYKRIYDSFIASRLKQQADLTSFETHHIIPRCIGGDDNQCNLVRLDPGEHLFAHILLAKIHGGWLATCAVRMLGMKKYRGRHSRMTYSSLRETHKNNVSRRWKGVKRTPEQISKMKIYMNRPDVKAKINTPDAAAKISAANTGKKRSEETKKRMSSEMKRRWQRADYCLNMREKLRGKRLSENTKMAVAEANRNRVITDVTRARMSASALARWRANGNA